MSNSYLDTLDARLLKGVSTTSDGDLFERGVIGQESGGKQFGADGKPLTSKAGAIGIAQVMPGTAPEAARLAGLPFDEQRYRTDADYNKALGRAYFNKQLVDFGNESMALAAYNAGPAAVRRAVQVASANGNPDSWLDLLPAETRNYVPSVLGRRDKAGQEQKPLQPAKLEIPAANAAPDVNSVFRDKGSTSMESKPQRTRGALEAANDTVIEFGNALAGGIGAVADFLAPGNAVSRGINDFIKDGESKQSDVVQAAKARFRDDLEAAEGVGDEVSATLRYVLENPLLVAAQGLGSFVPAGAAVGAGRGAAAIAKLGNAGKAAAGTAGGVVAGGMMSGGDAAGQAYQQVSEIADDVLAQQPAAKELLAQGKSMDEVRHELGRRAARVASVVPALIGAVSGAVGAERVLAKGGLAQKGVGKIAGTAAVEAGTEGLEEGVTAYSGNKAAQEYDPNIDPSKGVASAATLGAVMGGGIGGGVAALHPTQADPLAEVKAKAVEPNSPLSKAAVASNVAAEAVAAVTPPAEPQVDPITQKVEAIQEQVRSGGLIDALRSEESPVDVKAFLNDLATASSPSTQAHQREQAMTRLEFALGWAGKRDIAAPPPVIGEVLGEQGGDAPSGERPSVAQRRTAVDREAQLQQQLAAATTEAEREQIRAQMGVNREMRLRAPAQETAPNVAEPAAISPQEQQRLEAAALAGKDAARRAEDDPRQAVISRAMRSIEERGGVASPAEAQILAEAGLGQPYDRIDETLAPAPTVDQRLTQATGIALDKAPRSTQGAPSTEAAERAQEQNARSDSRMQRLAADRDAAAKARDEANAQPAEPAAPPAADSVIAALRTIPVLRSAEQRAVVAKARTTYTPEQMRILNDAANIPANLSATDKLQLEQLRQSAVRDEMATEDEVATETAAPRVTAPAGDGPAFVRKRRAQLEALARAGFTTVSGEAGNWRMVQGRTGTEIPLDGGADAQLARAAIARVVEERAHQAATSDRNDKRFSQAMGEAGNYARGEETVINGVRFRADNPRGTVRSGTAPDGTTWSTTMAHHYGDLIGTKGADGDPVDAFVGPRPDSERVFVIDQRNADGSFDEHKVMLGFLDEAAARAGYLASYEPGWDGLGDITEMTPEQFREWVKSDATRKPVGDIKKGSSNERNATGRRGGPGGPGPAGVDDDGAERGGGDDAAERAGGAAGAVPDAAGAARRGAGRDDADGAGRPADAVPVDQPPAEFHVRGDDGQRHLVRRVEPDSEAAQALRAIAGALGQQVYFFEGDRAAGDGFRMDARPGWVFLNARSGINPLAVFGHEVWHHIQQTEPQIAEAVQRVVAENMRASKDRRDRVGFTFNDYTRGAYDESQRVSELSADLFGNQLKTESFWSDVMAELHKLEGGQGLVARLVARLNAIVASVKRAVQALGDGGYNSERFIEDMDEVRAAYTQALAQYLKAQGVRPTAMQAQILRAQQGLTKSAARADTPARDRLDGQGLGRDAGGIDSAARGDDAAAARYGRPQEGSVSATGVHFGTAARGALNAAYYGTGLKGAERERLEGAENADIRPRIFFYVDKGNGIRPESGVGAYAHRVQLDNLYDVWADPLGIRKNNPGANNWERAIMRAGFDGYLSLDPKMPQGFAVLVGKQHTAVPTAQVVAPGQKAAAPTAPAEVREALMSKELREIDVSRIPGSRVDRSGTLIFPADARDQANAEMERIGSTTRFSRERLLTPADQLAAVRAEHEGKPTWMKAPNGKPTRLNERQWLHVRTPSFKQWFGDWEAFAGKKSGVWADGDGEVSKAVDENGEPLVVYHGTDKAGFAEFRAPGGAKRGDLGIFTTPDRLMARSYVRSGRGRDVTAEMIDEDSAEPGVYALFLNIREPNEADFDGANWDGSRNHQWVVELGDEIQFRADGKWYFGSEEEAEEFAADFLPPEAEEEGVEAADYVRPADDHYESTDSVVKEARRYGNDGAIIREVADDGGGNSSYAGDPADVFVVFSPKQLKSADFNGGEYSAVDGDIRKSTARKLERVDPMEVSTRAPSAKPKKVFAPEDSIDNLLIADFRAGAGQEGWMNAVANLVATYPGYREAKRATTPERQLERQIRFMADNLVWLHDQVPEEIRQRSKLWYDGARKIAERMSRKYGIEPSQAAGILAALSPQKDWFMNVSLADRVAQVMAERQSFGWSREMEETAGRIFAGDAYQESLGLIRGKTLGELDSDYLRAMWLRIYDEAHNPRSFMIVSPEGDLVAQATTIKGELAKPAWGGVSTIAKAVSIFKDGSFANINEQLGRKHKVRNFYNNILVPKSPNGHVTIDTHAVAAALLRALSGNSAEVMHNFGGPKSAHAGLEGTYALYEEAYRRAADALGLLPRELQSITWEAVRGLFVPGFKSQQKNVDAVDAIWYKYGKGRLSHDDARTQALELGGGIDAPGWAGRDPGAYAADEDAADAGDVPDDGVPGRGAGDDRGAVGRGARATASAGRRDGDGPAADRSVQAPERAAAQALTPLPGAPRVPGVHGPDPRLVAVAEQYARDHGIELRRQAEYVQVDEDRARRIAEAYDAMAHAPQDPRVKAAYADLVRQTRAQYDALTQAGYRFWFIDLERPDNAEYAQTPWNAMRDIRANRTMGVFPTDEGFGSDNAFDPQSNPLLEDTGLTWPSGGLDGKPKRVLANDLFRAVHDAFGHGLEGAGFRAQGEENAWQAHVRLFTGPAVGAITSETRGQNSWLNYGPHGEANRNAKVEDTKFADQKTGLMPEWTWTEGRAADAGGASSGPETNSQSVDAQTVAPYNPDDDTALQALRRTEQAAHDRVVELRKRAAVLESLRKCMG